MFAQTLSLALLASVGIAEARSLDSHVRFHGIAHKRQNTDSSATTLAANAIQTGSFLDGSDEIGSAEVGQAKSSTSQNNFINNCAGKTLTNGLQITTGSCNGITMGDIPAKTNMVSSIIISPIDASATIESDTTFNITVQTANLVAGSFTNADSTYYAAPQFLEGGKIVGHTHVTVQDLGNSLNPTTPLDPTLFAFFKGINDAGNGEGLLTATVTGGLPAGNYRVCTLASASNHQPVLMPVAQRGTADDCSKFTVVGSGTTINAAANDGAKGSAAAALAASAVADPGNTGTGVVTSAASTSTTSSASDTSTSTKAGNGGNNSGSKDTTTSSSSSEASSSSVANNGKGGKDVSSTAAASAASSGSASSGTVVEQVIVIETFFEFTKSLGGLPPSVGKQGESFVVLEEVFDDIVSAASAACGKQFEACTGFSGPGFSLEECTFQKDTCGSVASTQSSSAAPATLTATATVPVGATATGSVIAQSTVSISASATSAASSVASSIATAGAATSTSSTTSRSSTSTSAAIGGIAAPPVTNSGDATRPFEVNGNTFVNEAAALQRSCDIQFNACADAVNGQKLSVCFLFESTTQMTKQRGIGFTNEAFSLSRCETLVPKLLELTCTSLIGLILDDFKPVSGNWCWLRKGEPVLRYALGHG
ncbi:hypothetical protein G7Y89_g11632 [Cudoniella acicularis]|uniref:Uncharacterized protein n=1 Tax=Cudoniella acicularis TaxID=354080 RepID=A0A8H4RE59_9HELO|nr:hypothetical protein G7Y89_g11632 [Cudoniella acicularis]